MPDVKNKAPQLGKVLNFMRLLWAVDHGLQSTSKRMATGLGITGPQRLVIRIVGRFPGISAGELASIMHTHPSTLTGVLRRLEHRDIIVRSSDPADGRRALFKLSARGRALDNAKTGTVEAAVRRAMARVGDRKIVAAQDLLQALARELEVDV